MIHPEAVLRLAALLTPLCLILSACVTAKATSAPACGDFLDKQGDKPAYIEYQGCHRNTKGRASRWWRVTGWTEPTRPKPRTSCAGATGSNPCTSCAAAGNRRRIPVDEGHAWNLVFGSEETLVSAREQWPRIPSFHIRVEQYTEDP